MTSKAAKSKTKAKSKSGDVKSTAKVAAKAVKAATAKTVGGGNSTSAWAKKKDWTQIVMWGPRRIHVAAKRAAKAAGVGLSEFIRTAVEAKIAGTNSGTLKSKPKPKSQLRSKSVKKAMKKKNDEIPVAVKVKVDPDVIVEGAALAPTIAAA